MVDYDVEAQSFTQLKQLQKDLAKAISTYEDRQKAEAHAKVEAIARVTGISLAELISKHGKPNRVPVEAKYLQTENPAATSSGRGRKTQWIVDAHELGRAADDLAIG